MTAVSLKLSVKHDRKHDNPQMDRSVAINHSSNLHDLAPLDSGYTVLHFSFWLTLQVFFEELHQLYAEEEVELQCGHAERESGFPIFYEVLVDGCVPDKATQGAVVGGFGLGIEERHGKLLSW
ncbi:hypothetical protein D5086_022317 [Populus alba]|uniref:Uncharacterized protein n=1 Tax=Populus alba TaxID=43335 RepID=A0ACC4BEP0_POPAL